MAVSIATYRDRGRFVDNHNVLVDMYEGDGLAGDRYFVPATIHTSGCRLPQRASMLSDRVQWALPSVGIWTVLQLFYKNTVTLYILSRKKFSSLNRFKTFSGYLKTAL